jgi:hypothetical protein
MRAVAGQCGLAGPTLAMLGGRHRGCGNTLRAAVLGANDGLVSNLSLVMGVAGAAAAERTLLLTGLAGLVAGACSMAMGEWLSVTSSRNRQNEAQREKAKKAPIPAKGTAIRAQRVTPPEGNCRKGREKLHTTGSGEHSVRVVGYGSSRCRTLLCGKFPANREFYREFGKPIRL